ncbi:MAG TPA: hypothetical protein VFY16_02260, partial [Gemmatimonadaceae bacterium]|nr:hypothetical protein [Gemmatimonadaceae bacterium]
MRAGFPDPPYESPRGTPADALTIGDAPPRRTPLGTRLALRALQAGAVGVVLAAGTWRTFELDRFFLPKELALHLTALLAVPLALGTARGWTRTRVDLLLAAWLALGALSALLATNGWLAWRALAISVSGVLLFWTGRVVAHAGLRRQLLAALAMAVVLAAGTLLLQAYGVRLDVFSVNRAPGGMFGNRNFVAHLCAIGLPLLVLVALEARGAAGALLAGAGIAIVAAALVLSRSRAAWLAVLACAGVMLVAGWLGRARWRHGARGRRIRLVGGAAAAGTLLAVALPNVLDWRSDSPYLDSVRGVVNYREGSGAGRLVQFRTSLALVRR